MMLFWVEFKVFEVVNCLKCVGLGCVLLIGGVEGCIGICVGGCFFWVGCGIVCGGSFFCNVGIDVGVILNVVVGGVNSGVKIWRSSWWVCCEVVWLL